MIIVRRRSDGLYWNGARSNSHRNGEWIANINEVLPFTNKMGAKGAIGIREDWSEQPKCGCPRGHWKPYCEHIKAHKKRIKALWDERYEILNVRLEIVV